MNSSPRDSGQERAELPGARPGGVGAARRCRACRRGDRRRFCRRRRLARNIDVKPHALGRSPPTRPPNRPISNSGDGNVGVDVKWGIKQNARRRPHRQHRLCAGGGRSTGRQPHEIQRPLSRRNATSSWKAPIRSTSRTDLRARAARAEAAVRQAQARTRQLHRSFFYSRRIGLEQLPVPIPRRRPVCSGVRGLGATASSTSRRRTRRTPTARRRTSPCCAES